MKLRTPQAAIDLIKEFEGCRLEAYQCQAGVWTIGYGRTKGIRKGQVVTVEEADAMLMEDISGFEAEVDRLVTADVPDIQIGALVSLAFNIGTGAFAKSSLLKAVNAGGAVDTLWLEWSRYTDPESGAKCISNGLARRRRAELDLWHQGDDDGEVPAGAVVVKETPPTGPITKSGTLWGTSGFSLAGLGLAFNDYVTWFMGLAASFTQDFGPLKNVFMQAGANTKAMALGTMVFFVCYVLGRTAKRYVGAPQ